MPSKVVIGGEARELIGELGKIVRAQKRIEDSQRGLVDQSRKLNQQGTQAFKSNTAEARRMQREVAGLVTGLLGAQGAVQGVTSLFRSAREEAERFAETQFQEAVTTGRLKQVSETQEEFEELIRLSQELRESGAADTRGEANRIVFALDSSGLKDEFEFFKRILKEDFEGNVEQLIGAVEKQRANFGLTAQQATDQGLVAAGITQSELSDVLRAAAGPAQAARAVGIDSAQNLALVATLSKTAESLETGRTQAKRLLETLDERGIRGENLVEILRDVQSRIDRGQDVREIFSEGRALNAFRALSQNLETFSRTVPQIREAGGETLRRAEFVDPTFSLEAAQARRQAEGSLEVAADLVGVQQNLRESIIKLNDTLSAELGTGPLGRAFLRGADRTAAFLDLDFLITNQRFAEGFRRRAIAQGREDLLPQIDLLEQRGEQNRRIDRGEVPAVVQPPETPPQ